MNHLLEVRNLETEFSLRRRTVKAVNGVSYYLDEGEVVAFVGESGSGKSVTHYSGLQLIPMPPGRIIAGEVIFEGANLLSYSAASEEMRKVRGGKIGVVFQEPMTSLNPVMTIGRQLEEGIILHMGTTRKQARLHAVELLRKVGIPDASSRLDAFPHQFSGGMRQRIMIAIALSCNPRILIADEATSALDVTTQAQILELVKDLVVQTRTSLVIITHNLSVVARYADRVYVMYGGEIMETGTTREIFKDPHHPYTIGLLRAVPSLTSPKERKLVPIDGVVPDLSHRTDQCVFLNRCPFATDDCRRLPRPVLRAIMGNPARRTACHRNIDRNTAPGRRAEDFTRITTPASSPQMSSPILKVEHLRVYFPIFGKVIRRKIGDLKAVDDISFEVFRGENFGLVGESGCGKTTVARAILRLIEPSGGSVFFEGEDVSSLSHRAMRRRRRKISMVLQDPFGSLDPRQRAGDIVMEPLRNFEPNLSKHDRDRRVDELFDMVGLDQSYRERVPHEFSGGQRQRLAIARALATRPPFIVCDEAVSALDVSIQAQIINLLEELQQQSDLTYLFIAHDLSVVRHISDRIAVMYLGKIVETADWRSLYEHPMHPYTRALLESVPVPDPEIEATRKRHVVAGEVPSLLRKPEGCPFSTRCPIVTEICRKEMPSLTEETPGHLVACFNLPRIGS